MFVKYIDTKDNCVSKEEIQALEKDQFDIKTDLAVIKETMVTKTEFTEFKAEIKTEIAEFRTEVIEFKAEVKTDLRWIKAILFALLALAVKNTFFA